MLVASLRSPPGMTHFASTEGEPGPLYRQARALYWEFAHA
jgi:hypothetical protein